MRIAVIGSHGTGKTTICKNISKILKFNFIPDVVSEAFRLKFQINEETPPETQLWIMTKQIELERNTPEHWVMEKSLWDNIIYGSFSIKDKKVLNVLKNIVNSNARYDLVFYLPIEFQIPDDGVRSLNKDFQFGIDKQYRKYLELKKIKYIELKGSVEARTEKAIEVIKSRLKN